MRPAPDRREPLKVVRVAELASGPATSKPDALPCHAAPDGLYWHKSTQHGPVDERLTNFEARIAGQIHLDDGVEQHLEFEIEARLDGAVRRFILPAEQFAAMNWPCAQLGAAAIIYPGTAVKDRARAAVQLLSGKPPLRRVYSHAGWTRAEGRWCYLHAGGGLGADGPVDGVCVVLPGTLAGIHLPSPPEHEAARDAVVADLRFLDLAPRRITWPLLAATYRAPLGPSDFSMHLAGHTGTGKTELAALCQQHFGAGLDARNLPAAWSSTGNSLETLAFYAKDMLLVVDDFAPGGSPQEVARMHQQADRFLRAQGNASGRGRLASDGTLRSVRPPRGMTLSTGEDVPRGQSIRARLFVLELTPSDLNWNKLTELQQAAREGLFASAMSSYIRGVAFRHDEIQRELTRHVTGLRLEQAGQGHRRTTATEAHLHFGALCFLNFAREIGAIDQTEHTRLLAEAVDAISAAGADQTGHLKEVDPVVRFAELLRTALTSGMAHVVTVEGQMPEVAAPWGWHRRAKLGYGEEWQPQGSKVGWLAGEHLYLDQEAAYRAAQAVGGNHGEGLAIGARTLVRRLREAGLLISIDPDGKHLTIRQEVEGVRRRVLHLAVATLYESSTPVLDDVAEALS